jgi:hypothetical protein
MNEYQFDERLKHLETLMARVVVRVLGEAALSAGREMVKQGRRLILRNEGWGDGSNLVRYRATVNRTLIG